MEVVETPFRWLQDTRDVSAVNIGPHNNGVRLNGGAVVGYVEGTLLGPPKPDEWTNVTLKIPLYTAACTTSNGKTCARDTVYFFFDGVLVLEATQNSNPSAQYTLSHSFAGGNITVRVAMESNSGGNGRTAGAELVADNHPLIANGRFEVPFLATASTACTECSRGSYQDETGKPSCKRCSYGRFASQAGSTMASHW